MIYEPARYHQAAPVPGTWGSGPRVHPWSARGGSATARAAGHKEVRPHGLPVLEGAPPIPPQPGSRAEETGISMSQWGCGAVTRRGQADLKEELRRFPRSGTGAKVHARPGSVKSRPGTRGGGAGIWGQAGSACRPTPHRGAQICVPQNSRGAPNRGPLRAAPSRRAEDAFFLFSHFFFLREK